MWHVIYMTGFAKVWTRTHLILKPAKNVMGHELWAVPWLPKTFLVQKKKYCRLNMYGSGQVGSYRGGVFMGVFGDTEMIFLLNNG